MSVSTILLVAIIAFLALKGLIGDSGHQMHYPGLPSQPQSPRIIPIIGTFLIGITCLWLLFSVFTGGNWSKFFPLLPETPNGENTLPANLKDKPTKINEPPRQAPPPESFSEEKGGKTLVNQPPMKTRSLKKIVLLTRNATPEQAATLKRTFRSHDIASEVSADDELLVYIQYFSKEEGKTIYQQWKNDTETCRRFRLNPQLMDLIY